MITEVRGHYRKVWFPSKGKHEFVWVKGHVKGHTQEEHSVEEEEGPDQAGEAGEAVD